MSLGSGAKTSNDGLAWKYEFWCCEFQVLSFWLCENFESEFKNSENLAEKKNLGFVHENFAKTFVVANMNFGSKFALEVVDNSVEVLWILKIYRENGHQKFFGCYFLKNFNSGRGVAKRSSSESVVFDFSENLWTDWFS